MLKVIYQPKGRAAEYCPWAANLYRGCGHGCLYCYAPSALQMPIAEFHSSPVSRPDIIGKLIRDSAELQARNEHIKICSKSKAYYVKSEGIMNKSSIQVSPPTKEKLDKLGSKGDTYEGIIIRLLEHYERTKGAYPLSPVREGVDIQT